jgi:nicotinamide phosphoribosyltransferase
MNTNWNIIKASDSYKISHKNGYCPKLEILLSYLESRGGKYKTTIFFGLQYYLKMIEGVQVTSEKIDEAQSFWEAHFGRKDVFNREAWEYILEKHGGKLPLKIRAVKEGANVPTNNVLMTIENTDPKCYWLTNFVETLLMKVWYPITIATQSNEIKKNIINHLNISGTPETACWRTHDFGYRGVTCEEHAAIGSAAHLISFNGTDTVAGIVLAQNTYNAEMCGFSIPATEHSIMCSFGRENEIEACRNFLNQYPDGLIACVSDTYNIYNCCENIWGGVLKDIVINRKGKLVVRPDSGDFFEVIPKVLDILWNKFGGTINDKGYKVLDPHIGVIQGDGMEPETINALYTHIVKLGWSADNLTVGSGGGLLVKDVTRDTNKFAIKACAARVDGKWIDIFKEPITDTGKRSKKGKLKLVIIDGEYKTVKDIEYPELPDELVTVFENGVITKTYAFEEIKNNVTN